MKAITIKQPFASLIANDIKDIENRTWACPKKYIGQRVLIHSGKALCRKSIFETLTTEQYKMFREKVGYSGLDFLEPKGYIIGSVQIVDCVVNHPSVWADKTENHTVGMNPRIHEDITGKKITYNWVLANPILFNEPIRAKGKLSFWDYPNINSEDGICLCQIAVDEKNQVMNLCGEYRCWYCGGKWSK